MHHEASATIPAPTARVWEVLVDVERWPEWTASMSTVELVGGGGLAVGSEVIIKQPRLAKARWRVTELEAGRAFTWVAKAPGIHTTATHRVEPADGASRVTLSIDQRGIGSAILGLFINGMTRRYVAMELAGLAERSTS